MAILRTNGFVQLRRGLQEHVTNGSMSVGQLGIYCLLLMNADPSTGIWRGSAGLLAAVSGESPRTCRDAFERLEGAGYIKRFAVQGRHGSYPILVHRFDCSDGAMKGKRLNALNTVDSKTPIYESRHDNGNDNGNESVNDDVNESAAKYLDNKRTDTKRKKPSRDKREGDPRHTQFKALLSAYWAFSNPGSEMPWDGKEAGALGSLLKASPNLSAEQFKKCLYNRHLSEGINTSDRPSLWLHKTTSYEKTALDQYNHPKNGATNGHANKGDERERSIKQTLARALDEMGSEEAGENDGVLPLGVTRH
jgi:hypothetical protein